MSEHTPGPWKVAGYLVVTSNGTVYTFENETTKAGELRANAHLMAAAPDCKKALEQIWDTIKQRCGEFQTPTRLQWMEVVDDVLTLCEDALNKTEPEATE